ncbi:MAG: hypothetical protein LBG62_01180 [Candidatus Methanoplasma sp.]|jgi:hypothetical protein|nr:hypothetical protein [Candidatus Methanoplasma sp.]
MITDEVREDMGAFDVPVIGVTMVAGVPAAVLVFHDGRLASAALGEAHSGGMPVGSQKSKEQGTVPAPAGMEATVRVCRVTKNLVRDFKVYRESRMAYSVEGLRLGH